MEKWVEAPAPTDLAGLVLHTCLRRAQTLAASFLLRILIVADMGGNEASPRTFILKGGPVVSMS